jgi:hypothetical protein
MPRYRFTIRDTDRYDDEDGVILLDDGAAHEYAVQILNELQSRGTMMAWHQPMPKIDRVRPGGPPRVRTPSAPAPISLARAVNRPKTGQLRRISLA